MWITMITQAIKRWLSRMFAWWPWKQTPVSESSYAASNMNPSTMPDVLWFPPADGPAPQPGNRSIAVDQERGEIELPGPGARRTDPDDRPETPMQQVPGAEENIALTLRASSAAAQQVELSSISASEATPEQRMAFLRYLVKHGHINEGFAEDKTPEQYKHKHL